MESMKDRGPPDLRFPDGFGWGVATASYQTGSPFRGRGCSPMGEGNSTPTRWTSTAA